MGLNPYLYFDGNCREAFEFYAHAFQGTITFLNTYGEGPPQLFASQPAESIMHVTLEADGFRIHGSDQLVGESLVPGNNIAISYQPPSMNMAEEVFQRLSVGGSIIMELQETFWGAYYGKCTDRFGVHWIVNFPMPSAT